ncbi:MAG: hypothetical protein AB7V16_03620 [Vulcanibacillus sp.]
MFFHGIKYEYLLFQYPVLSPELILSRENKEQLKDRKHLIERFGFEPVHLLQASGSFPVRKCLETCFKYGNIVFMFNNLSTSYLQLSENEIGVREIDVRRAKLIFINQPNLIDNVKKLFTDKKIYLVIDKEYFSKGLLIN